MNKAIEIQFGDGEGGLGSGPEIEIFTISENYENKDPLIYIELKRSGCTELDGEITTEPQLAWTFINPEECLKLAMALLEVYAKNPYKD